MIWYSDVENLLRLIIRFSLLVKYEIIREFLSGVRGKKGSLAFNN